MKLKNPLKALRGICWVQRLVRRLSAWAWDEMLLDVARVEWKFGRNDNGQPKNWTEWDNVRGHLRAAGRLRKPQELVPRTTELSDLPNDNKSRNSRDARTDSEPQVR